MNNLLAKGVAVTLFSLFAFAPAQADDNGIAYAIHKISGIGAKVCMLGHHHVGDSPRPAASRQAALKSAVHHWSNFTTLEYGSDWGAFGRSVDKSVDCGKVSSRAWTCKVRSTPCRSRAGMRLRTARR